MPADRTYVIAEVGQNHNGDMSLASQLIDMAAIRIFDAFNQRELPGVDAIKFTKRDLSEEMTVDAYNAPYDSPHSYGATYGQHREKLELDYEQHAELEKYARSRGLGFVETLTSIKTVRLLDTVNVDAIKVASRDLTNLSLLEELAKTRKRIILSTGMGDERDIDNALDVITRYHDDIAILHCVSQYPADYENLNLMSIPYLKKRYPYDIGFSDHSIGIVMAPIAVSLGASIVEKHITLSRSMKGSDHAGSLEPDGLWRMVRDIRNTESALGELKKTVPDAVTAAKEKLTRSLAAVRDIKAGEMIREEDLCMLSPGTGIPWIERDTVVGRRAANDIQSHTLIDPGDLTDGEPD